MQRLSGRVLLLEHKSELAGDVRSALEDGGYDVTIVTSWEAAFRELRTTRADVAMVSLQFLTFTGTLAARRLRTDYGLGIVVLSPSVLETDALDRLVESSAVAGVSIAPVDRRQLLATASLAQRHHQQWLTQGNGRDRDGADGRAFTRWDDQMKLLSPREREVCEALLSNRRVSHIARDLFISPYTVRNHLKAVFRKLGVNSQAQLLERLWEAQSGAPPRPSS